MAIFSALPPPWPSWIDEWHCPWPIIRSLFCFLGVDWLPMTSSEFHMWEGTELRGESGAPGDPTVFVDDSRVPLTPNLINHLIYLNLNGSLKHGVLEEPFHGVGNTHYSFVSITKIARRWRPRSLARSQHCTKPTLGGVTVFPENIIAENWIELLKITSSAVCFKILWRIKTLIGFCRSKRRNIGK